MKNILFLTSWYPTRILPDNGDFVQRHAEAVAKYAHVFVLYCCFDKQLKQPEVVLTKKGNLTECICYAPEPALKNTFCKALHLRKVYFQQLSLLANQYHFTPDLIHVHVLYPVGLVAVKYGKKKHLPVVASEHWSAFITNQITFFQKWAICYVAKKMKKIMPVSEYLADHMKKNGVTGDYEIVGNVVDTHKFLIKEKPDYVTKVKFVHISTLKDSIKNVSGILQASDLLLKEGLDFELHIMGGGNDEAELKQLAHDLGLNSVAFFHGMLSHDKVAEQLPAMDVLINFSNYETFSIIIAEAMACGLAIITTRCGGLTYELTDDYVEFVKIKDVSDLAAKMKQFIQRKKAFNPDKQREYVVDHYDNDAIAKKIMAVYEQFIS